MASQPLFGAPQRLTCEYRINPIGIDEPRPRFGWLVNDARQGAAQSAWQIVVGTHADRAAMWDSGRVDSDESALIEYDGRPLESNREYLWQARTWDKDGKPSPWSEVNAFDTGLLRASDWQARWVACDVPADKDDPAIAPSPRLRRTFSLPATPTRARLFITARGVYESQLNGTRIGADHLTPGWTDYHKRIHYQTYDVTHLLRGGDNEIAAILGTGWYCGHVAWWTKIYGTQPWLLAQLHIELDDGSTQTIVSDDKWTGSTGPILGSDLIMGETYDARLAFGRDEQPVKTEPITTTPTASPMPPVRRMMELPAKQITEPLPGAYIFDMAQNMVGVARLKIRGNAGDIVTMRFAEVLNDDGTLYTTNLRAAKQTDRYILRGDPQGETYEPRFTFHGFRYVEVTGLAQRPDTDMITGLVMHTDMPHTGSFECSHALINQLQHNIEWGQRGNYLEIPTDCPQRDERLGWTGDAQVFARTGCYNFDIAPFMTKWLNDLFDAQRDDGGFVNFAPEPRVPVLGFPQAHCSAAWMDAAVIVPWTIYLCYGDERLLHRCYPQQQRYIEYLQRNSEGFIRPAAGYGDWLSVECMTPLDLIATAYFARSCDLMSKIARVVGKDADARHYADLFGQVRDAFRRRFVTPDGRVVGDTQTSYVLALHFDLLPDSIRPAALNHLVRDILEPYPYRNGHISTGFVGCGMINFALGDNGRADVAYKLLTNEDYPSWLFPVKNGATTIWEHWNGWTPEKGFTDPGMNSFNHYAFGAIGEWMYRRVAGIDVDPDNPGYRHIIIRPQPPADGCIKSVQATYDSIRGRVVSGWRVDGDNVRLDVTIPANTRATAHLPDGKVESVGPGRHQFISACCRADD
jgi:alpha-L-rhamnosidase